MSASRGGGCFRSGAAFDVPPPPPLPTARKCSRGRGAEKPLVRQRVSLSPPLTPEIRLLPSSNSALGVLAPERRRSRSALARSRARARRAATAASMVVTAKRTGCARPHLRQPAEIGPDHGRDLGIAAGHLAIRHQHHRPAVAQHLDRAHDDAVGDDVQSIGRRDLRPSRKYAMRSLRCETVQARAAERLDLLAREVVVLRAEDDADRIVAARRATAP